MFTAYNLRRLMSILAPEELKEALKGLKMGLTGLVGALWNARRAILGQVLNCGAPERVYASPDSGQFAFRSNGYF